MALTKKTAAPIAPSAELTYAQVEAMKNGFKDLAYWCDAQAAMRAVRQREQEHQELKDQLTHGRTQRLGVRDKLRLEDNAAGIALDRAKAKTALDAAYSAALEQVRAPLRRELNLRLAQMEQAVEALLQAATEVAKVEEISGRFLISNGDLSPSGKTPLVSDIGTRTVERCRTMQYQFKFALVGE